MTSASSASRVRVRYAETDKMGVVYYANYLVWFEVARADLLRSRGWTYREMESAGISLPVIEAHCEYRRPARYDDEIEVRTEGRMLSPVRMEFQYEVVRVADQTILLCRHTAPFDEDRSRWFQARIGEIRRRFRGIRVSERSIAVRQLRTVTVAKP